jgi:hypothetical protein
MKPQSKLLWVLSVGLFFALLASNIPGYAQQNISFASVQIDLWPEYDEPEMLVVSHYQFSPSVQLPVELEIRIPSAARLNAVAETSIGGQQLLNVPYTTATEGEWMTLQFIATKPLVQVEYYDPALEKDGIERTYVYHWPGDYDVDQVVIIVQQPIGAEEMSIFPSLNDLTPDPENGILYYKGEIGSYAAGETFDRTIAYEKDSNTLTVEFLNVESDPVNENTPGRVSLVNFIPWGIGLLGLFIIVAGVYWYWATEKRQPKAARKGAATGPASKVEDQRDIYCYQCGKRAESGDKFCRSCGTKLRL